MNEQRRKALLREYGEVSTLFRTLTDIRFQLLGILPIASAVTAAVGARTQSGGEIGVPIALALFGLASAVGFVTYNARNDQLYNELVGRAAAIERSIGLPDGAFIPHSAHTHASEDDIRIFVTKLHPVRLAA